MNISIYIKSGTGRYSDINDCDMLIKEFKNTSFPIPRIGESLEILEPNDAKRINKNGKVLKEYHQYLITDIHYWIIDEEKNEVSIYVVPIGRSVE